MIIQYLDRFLYDQIWAGLSKYGLNNVTIYGDYSETKLIPPTISIGFSKQLDLPLELGPAVNGVYYYNIDIYAQSKTQRDDIITAVESYLDQSISGLSNGSKAIITEIKPIEPNIPNIVPSNYNRKYYYITLDGYSGYGVSPHNIQYANNTISIETDFTCDQFITSGSRPVVVTEYYNTAYDATIIFYGPGNFSIATGEKYLEVYQSAVSTLRKDAFLVINTQHLLDTIDLNSINLYFYANIGIYPYRSNIYILHDCGVPIVKATWFEAKSLIGEVEITGAGWYNISVPSNLWTYIDNLDYTIFRMSAISTGETLYIDAFESGVNNAYLEASTSAVSIYETTYLVDKFDEDELSGFKLWLNSGGYINFSRGFSGSVITAQSSLPIVTGVRNHLAVGSRYAATTYDVNIFLNDVLVSGFHSNWFIPPKFNANQVNVGVNNDNGILSGYGDIKLYGLRITNDYINTAPAMRGEFLAANKNLDILDLRCNEGCGNIAYDYRKYNDMTLISGFEWNNYLNEVIRTDNKDTFSASLRAKIEVVEYR